MGTSSARLRKVTIENFRSIVKMEVDLNDLTILVGKNDSGKSNIMRALNLFFNNKTSYKKDFDFNDDFNCHVVTPAKKAKEIRITVEFDLPETYHDRNGEIAVWKKTWRKDGLQNESEADKWLLNNIAEAGKKPRYEALEIPPKSNVRSLLGKVKFEYVPAIKDSLYFDELRGRIYKTLAQVSNDSFEISSQGFENSIAKHISDLTLEINESLGIATSLALPQDLSHVFERLDFIGGENRISLESRGDGIKTRHIPLILKFIATKLSSIREKGSTATSFFWAYEEPENNLEMASALELSKLFKEIAVDGNIQVLMTTHSPAFYDLSLNNNDFVTTFFVYKEGVKAGTEIMLFSETSDVSMGTLAVFGARIKKIIDEMSSRIEADLVAKQQAEEIAKDNLPIIFVEGSTDKTILEKAAKIFFPKLTGKFIFKCKPFGGGDNWVIDMVGAWYQIKKHDTSKPEIVGVVDEDAKQKVSELKKSAPYLQKANFHFISPKQELIEGRKLQFRNNAYIETLYSNRIWKWMKQNKKLEEIEPTKFMPEKLISDVMKCNGNKNELEWGGQRLGEIQKAEWYIYSQYKVRPTCKGSIANHICRENSETANEDLMKFKDELEKIFKMIKLL